MLKKKFRSYNILGSIAIINFPRKTKEVDKLKFAKQILHDNKVIKTVLEKSGNFKGRLRKMQTKLLAGENTKEVLYKENGCTFRFNIDTTYFSPRLSNERNEIAKQIKNNEVVLVMFAGVSPFPIVIAKNSAAKQVYSNEINREANKYSQLNIELNSVKEKVTLLPGDIKRVAPQIIAGKFNTSKPEKSFFAKKDFSGFDVIIMPRPQLKDSFLEQAFALSKKGTKIYYYDFCQVDEVEEILHKVQEQAKLSKRKIKIFNVKEAGEIAPYRVRLRVDMRVTT